MDRRLPVERWLLDSPPEFREDRIDLAPAVVRLVVELPLDLGRRRVLEERSDKFGCGRVRKLGDVLLVPGIIEVPAYLGRYGGYKIQVGSNKLLTHLVLLSASGPLSDT